MGVLLLGALLAAASLAPPRAAAIIDGERVATADAPWAVSLQIPIRGKRAAHHCSGTVIGPRRVATARHCVEHPDVWQRIVVTGSDDPERQEGSRTRVAHVWAATTLDYDSANVDISFRDLAVVETTGDLRAPALPLTPPDAAFAPAESVWSYGYGFTNGEDDNRSGPSLLRRAHMRLHTRAECAESDFGDEPFSICARRFEGPGGGVLDNGDSGGGLVRQGPAGLELLGVNSVGTRGMLALQISGFASVPALHDFVTAPETGYELPLPRGRAKVSGKARVGARLRCSATFAPAPRVTRVHWLVTPRKGRARIQSAKGAWKVPASARGGTVACAAYGGATDFYGSRTEWSRATAVRR